MPHTEANIGTSHNTALNKGTTHDKYDGHHTQQRPTKMPHTTATIGTSHTTAAD